MKTTLPPSQRKVGVAVTIAMQAQAAKAAPVEPAIPEDFY